MENNKRYLPEYKLVVFFFFYLISWDLLLIISVSGTVFNVIFNTIL